MFANRLIGWSALVLFVAATAILTILFISIVSPAPGISIGADPQIMILASADLAIFAFVLGFLSFQTSPGKVAAVGGLVLAITMLILLSFTFITRVERSGTQLESIAMEVMSQ